jgi:hypothetical protein
MLWKILRYGATIERSLEALNRLDRLQRRRTLFPLP